MSRQVEGRRQPERRDPRATRQALLEAGAALFAERGLDGASTEDIAHRAGVNKALISYHFGGKRGLYAAILESHFSRMTARLERVEKDATDARQLFHAFLETFLEVARETPGFPTLFLREVLSSGIEPRVIPHLVQIVGMSRRLAERASRERLFRKVDPITFHFGLVGALVFFFSTEQARRKAAAQHSLPFAMPDAKAFVRYVEELTLRGLAPAEPAPDHAGASRKGARV
jgi:TetR/AcrR family transcriptional regulator